MSARTKRRLKQLEAPTQTETIVEAPEPFDPRIKELYQKYGHSAWANHNKLTRFGLTTKQAEEILKTLKPNNWISLEIAQKLVQPYLKNGELKK